MHKDSAFTDLNQSTGHDDEMKERAGYSVHFMHDCRVVWGHIPDIDLAALSMVMSGIAMESPKLAARLGASHVLGTADGLDRLDREITANRLDLPHRIAAQLARVGYDRRIVSWVEQSAHHDAAYTLFGLATHVHLIPRDHQTAPNNAEAFRQCMVLLDTIYGHADTPSCEHPDWGQFRILCRQSVMTRLHGKSEWRALAHSWGILHSALEQEHPEWRTQSAPMPETDALMRAITAHEQSPC